MKHLIVIIALCVVPIVIAPNAEAEWSPMRPMPTNFQLALKHILINEGYYSNEIHDKGRETYAGITRRYNKDWYGWRYIDQYDSLSRHQYIRDNDLWVIDYYVTIWVKEHFDQITSQNASIVLFDLRIHSANIGVKIIQRSLNQLGNNIKIDGRIGEATIEAINQTDYHYLIDQVRCYRKQHLLQIIDKDSTQVRFLKGWLRRINTEPIVW